MTQTEEAQAIETPTDDPTPKKRKRKRKPSAANRYRLFSDGEGDYRIYEVVNDAGSIPKGCLIPIAGVPGFKTCQLAKNYIKNSGDKLNGKQMMILKGLEMCTVMVETVTKVTTKFKERQPVTGPAASAGEDGK